MPPDGEASLDADYLEVLPDDAIPALVAALPGLPDGGRGACPAAARIRAGSSSQNEPAYTSPFAWNLGRERAKAALATLP